MVVRLKDLDKEGPKKSGVVRLKDLGDSPKSSGPVRLSDLQAGTEGAANNPQQWGYSTADRSAAVPYRPEEKAEDNELMDKLKNSDDILGKSLYFLGNIGEKLQDTFVGKATDKLMSADEVVSNFKAGALDTGTLGLSQGIGRAGINATPGGNENLLPKLEDRTDALSYKVGEFAGYIPPGAAIERGVAKLVSPLLKESTKLTGKMARGALTAGLAGVAEGAAQEAGDVVFREGEFDPLNVAIGGTGGAVLGGVAPAVGAGVSKLVSKLKGAPKVVDDAVEPLLKADDLSSSMPKLDQPTVSQPLINDSLPPTVVDDVLKERGFSKTLKASEKTPQGFKERLRTMYTPQTNEETLSLATSRINRDVEEATSYVLGNERYTAEKAATAQRLIDHYNSQGNYQRAVDIAEKVSEEATKAGQAIQALSMFNKLSPEGVLVYAQRMARKTNEKIPVGMGKVEVTEDMAAQLTGLAQATRKMTGVQELSNNVIDILERAKTGAKLSDADSETLKRFVQESQQFVKETTRKPKPPRPPQAPKDKRVRDNVVSFLDAQEQAAKERLRARGIQISSTPLDVWADYAVIGAAKMGKGVVKFSDWSESMIKDLGESIRPHLENLYERASEAYEQSVKKISSESVERARKAVTRVTSEERKVMDEMTAKVAEKVKEVITKAKSGNVVDGDLQEIRDLSDELAEMLPESQIITPDKKYLQAVKSLSKKLAGVENVKQPPVESVKEVQKLLSTITKLADEGKVKTPKVEINDEALESLGYQLMERTKPRVISEQEKLAEKAIKHSKKSLTDSEIDSIRTLAQKVSGLSGESKRLASQDLQSVLQALDKPSKLRQISTVQTIGQLLNPKTQVRNALGNELFYRIERLNKLIATPIDIARSKLTGGPRTVTFRTHNQGKYWENWMRGLKAGWKGVNVNGLETQYDLGSPAFKGKYNPLTYLEKALGASLKSFDTAAYMRAYNNTLGEQAVLQLKNQGKKVSKEAVQDIIRQADDNMMKIADEYGRYVTFQDNNLISKGLVSLKKGLNLGKDWGAGDLILKYPKTPGALLMRALEYSPAGFVRSGVILAKPWFKKEPNTAELMQSLSRAIIGTMGLSGMGYFLMDKGVLTGAASKDKDIRELQKAAGQGQYQVNLSALKRFITSNFDPNEATLREGDMLYSYDWMQPVSMAISIGANTNKNINAGDQKISGLVGTVYNSLEGGLGTLTEQSVLGGLKRAVEGYPGQTVTDKIMDILSDVPASFVPTLSNQIRQLQDPYNRETYDPSKLSASLNRAQNRIPGMSNDLPQQYDTLGGEKRPYQNNSLFNVAFNPGFVSRYKLSDEARYVVDLINETGDETLAPRAPQKSITIDGVSVKLTGEEYSRLQRYQGEETRKLIEKRMKRDMNKRLEKRVDNIKDGLTDAGKEARDKLKKEIRR